MKNKDCKICGEHSGKRNVCGNCKEKYPVETSGKSGKPFNRKELYEKNLRRKNK